MKYNKGHDFEALDRVHILASMVQDFLLEHPAILEFGLQKDVGVIISKLGDLYQKLGGLSYPPDRDWETRICTLSKASKS